MSKVAHKEDFSPLTPGSRAYNMAVQARQEMKHFLSQSTGSLTSRQMNTLRRIPVPKPPRKDGEDDVKLAKRWGGMQDRQNRMFRAMIRNERKSKRTLYVPGA